MELTREVYDETRKFFKQLYIVKPVVFLWRLASIVQQLVEKLTNTIGDLHILALKAYPKESTGIRKHLILREFLKAWNIVKCGSTRVKNSGYDFGQNFRKSTTH